MLITFMKSLLILLLSASVAHAAVIYSGVQNIAIPATFDGVYLNIDNGSTSTNPITGWDINPFFGGFGVANSASFQPVRVGTGVEDALRNLDAGAYIGSTSVFSSGDGGSATHTGTDPGQFALGTPGYIGFRFLKDNSSGPYYGWMKVTFTANTSGGLIQSWAYDDSGGAIMAGSFLTIPEPGRVSLLAFGFIGMWMRRRRVCSPAN